MDIRVVPSPAHEHGETMRVLKESMEFLGELISFDKFMEDTRALLTDVDDHSGDSLSVMVHPDDQKVVDKLINITYRKEIKDWFPTFMYMTDPCPPPGYVILSGSAAGKVYPIMARI